MKQYQDDGKETDPECSALGRSRTPSGKADDSTGRGSSVGLAITRSWLCAFWEVGISPVARQVQVQAKVGLQCVHEG